MINLYKFFMCKCGLLWEDIPFRCDYCGNSDLDEFKEVNIE